MQFAETVGKGKARRVLCSHALPSFDALRTVLCLDWLQASRITSLRDCSKREWERGRASTYGFMMGPPWRYALMLRDEQSSAPVSVRRASIARSGVPFDLIANAADRLACAGHSI